MDSTQNSDVGDTCETGEDVKNARIVKYNMSHKHRGIALIFNHEYFDSIDVKRRTGTNVDCAKLINSLKFLNFEVSDYHNQTVKEVKFYLDKAAKIDHTDNDCICICILSHGDPGYIYAKDATYKTDLLWKNFTEDKCPSLAGKPKLFFIQACQGKQTDAGIEVETDGDSTMNYKIFQPDFLFACSTIPGFYSWRNPTNGSWFIQALCAQITSCGKECDILTLLTYVCRDVAIDFQSYNPYDLTMHQKKQIPCIDSMLTRILKFK